jgi:diacylglycerol kinase family enzyme
MSGSPDPAGEPDATGPVFVVMAGIGFDAAMMRDAPERLKSAVGWPAYLVGAARNLRRRPTRIRLSLDSSPAQEYSVRAVLVGNVGRLQAGAELLPDAVPDDGVLDVCLVAPRSAVDWLVLAVRTLLHRPVQDRRMTRLRATRIEVRTQQPLPRQLDGDVIEAGTSLSVHVQPGALLICCAPVREDAPAISDNRTTEAPR